MKRFLKVTALTLALAVLPMLALADDLGSAAVTEGRTYTLEQMLTYAMQDEYMAEAEYAAIQAAFGVSNPYANIMQAELTHQEMLRELFSAYGLAVPANTAAGSVVIPATLQETYEIGVQAEINNIAMYQAFLAQGDVPQDVRAVFEDFIKASQSHLEAFTRNAEKFGSGLGNGQEYGRGRSDETVTTSAFGLGNGNQSANQAAAYGQGNGGQAVNQTAGNGQGNSSRMVASAAQTYGRMSSQTAGNRSADMQTRGMGSRDGAGLNADNCDDCTFCDGDQTAQPRGGRWN